MLSLEAQNELRRIWKDRQKSQEEETLVGSIVTGDRVEKDTEGQAKELGGRDTSIGSIVTGDRIEKDTEGQAKEFGERDTVVRYCHWRLRKS